MKQQMTADVLIIGAGASGLAAACAAASSGGTVIAVDGNDRPGRKLSATGNGRCNFTNVHCSPQDYNQNAAAFVERALRRFDPDDTLRFFRENGMLVREEQEGRCYPYSGQAAAVTKLLVHKAELLGVDFRLGDTVSQCVRENDGFTVRLSEGGCLTARSLIIATGGRAGLHFGSTGDGYGFAKAFGHSLNAPRPALVACESEDPCLKGMKGRARAQASLVVDGKTRYSEYGEVQFTGSGISGICVMNLTRYMDAVRPVQKKKKRLLPGDDDGRTEKKNPEYVIRIDFIPEFDAEIIAAILKKSRETVSLEEALSRMVNDRIASAIAGMAGESPERASALLKRFDVRIRQTRGWKEAQVTCGGIRMEEIDPDTMGSLLVPGLFFCGEVIDVDGHCGGYNLQWAWSSGYLSGVSAAEYALC